MKTKIIAIFCVLLTIMLAGSAFASLTVTDFTLGDDNTKRYNPEGDDDDDQEGDIETAEFTITSVGNDTTGITLNFGALVNEYNLSFSDNNFDLAQGASKTILVTGIISENLGSLIEVDNDGDDQRSIQVGTFTVSGTQDGNAVSASGTMSALAETGLEIGELEIVIDGVAYDLDDDEAQEITPGSSVAIRFEIENNFDDESNLDIEGDIDLDSDNSDVEFDDKSEDLDVGTEDTESFTFDLDIDWGDVEDGDDATLEISIEGDDENGAIHLIEMLLDIGFEYPDAEIEVNNFEFSSRTVCPGDIVEFSYEIENTGTDDQDNIQTRLRSNLLDIEVLSGRFDIDGRDDEDTESRFFSEGFEIPNDADARAYDMSFEVFYEDEDGDDASKFETYTLTVEDCSGSSTSGGSSSSGSNNNNNDSGNGFVVDSGSSTSGNTATPTPNQPTTSNDNTNTGTAVVTAQPKDDGSALQTFGIIVLVIILLAVIVSLVGMLLRK